MLKAKNIIISIITMAAVLFSIVMIPNTALADTWTRANYEVTADGTLLKDGESFSGTDDVIVVIADSDNKFMEIKNSMSNHNVTVEYVWIGKVSDTIYSNSTLNLSPGYGVFIPGETLYIHWDSTDYVFTITRPAPTGNSGSEESGYAHVHNFVHCIITNPTEEMDGLEGEQCVCGAIRNTSVISSDIVFYENLYKEIDNAKSGQTIVLELKRRNTFTGELLEKLAAKNNTNFVIRFTGNDNKRYEISVQAGALDGMEFTEKYYGYKAVAGFLEMQEIAR